jgi:hypothetical protein
MESEYLGIVNYKSVKSFLLEGSILEVAGDIASPEKETSGR